MVFTSAGGDLSAAVGAEQWQAGKLAAESQLVAIFAAIEQRAAPDAGKHQTEIRLAEVLARRKQGLVHVLLASQWLAQGPDDFFAWLECFGQGQRTIGIGGDYGDAGLVRLKSGLSAIEQSRA